jgi:hypothetical protein
MLSPEERRAIRERMVWFREHPWHAGRHTGKTLYNGEGAHDDLGRMDTPAIAARVVQLTRDAVALQDYLDALEPPEPAP